MTPALRITTLFKGVMPLTLILNVSNLTLNGKNLILRTR